MRVLPGRNVPRAHDDHMHPARRDSRWSHCYRGGTLYESSEVRAAALVPALVFAGIVSLIFWAGARAEADYSVREGILAWYGRRGGWVSLALLGYPAWLVIDWVTWIARTNDVRDVLTPFGIGGILIGVIIGIHALMKRCPKATTVD